LLAAEHAARLDAERASRVKDQFLATLSHELRTPLTPALLTASLLEERPGLPEDVRADIATIRRNIELERQLIDDLLDLSRIARGKGRFDCGVIDMTDVLRAGAALCGAGGRA